MTRDDLKKAVVWASALFTFALWLVIAVAHVDDAWGNGKVSGGWLVLGQAADEGTLYPPLVDDGFYGGSRWMPLPILTFALAHRLSPDGYWTAKLLVYCIGLVLLAVLYVALRQVGVPRDIGVGLVALVLLVPVGFDAATVIRGDALATLLQLAALVVVYGRRRSLSGKIVVAAASLCALGFLARFSAVWAPLAILIVLSVTSRRLAVLFAAATGTLIGLGVVLTDVGSSGRFSENLPRFAFTGSGIDVGSLLDAPAKLVALSQARAPGMVLLAPLAILVLIRGLGLRRFSLFEVAFVLALGVTVGAMVDPGAGANHLLDAVILTPIIAGSLSTTGRSGSALATDLLRVTVVVAVFVAVATHVRPVVAEAVADLRGGSTTPYGPDLLRDLIPPESTLLSHDPGVPYALDRRPVVSDPYMLPRTGAIEPLLGRVKRREFDFVVFLDLPVDDLWFYREGGDFGPRLAGTICRTYRLDRKVGDYFVYRPGAPDTPCPRGSP